MDTLPQDDAVADVAPWSEELTVYDKAHLRIYIRILDAENQGAHPDEVCEVLLGINFAMEPDRARKTYESHRRRAVWFTEVGYRKLLED